MMSRVFLATVLVLADGIRSEENVSQTKSSRPHVLLIVADDLGWNDVSWHNPEVLTPNLQELALGGVVLNRSYVQPICTPTRSALMTGRYPFTIGRQRSTIRPSEPTGLTLNATLLPQAMKKLGYTTHAVGKWHLGFCSWSYTPTYRGFDTYYGYYNGAEDYFTHTRSNLEDPYDTGPFQGFEDAKDGGSSGFKMLYSLRTNLEESHIARSNLEDPYDTGPFQGFEDAKDEGSSGFKMLYSLRTNLEESHIARASPNPGKFRTSKETKNETGSSGTYKDSSNKMYLDLRNNTEPDHNKSGIYSSHLFASYVEDLLESRDPDNPMFLYLPFQSVHAPLMVPENYTKHYKHIRDLNRRTYLGMVTALDEAVGRVVDALKKTGHYNNSVIIFTTDNGGTCKHGGNNWPLRGMKTTLWEGGTRGVSFVHSPLLPNPGTVSNKLIHATDWFQTVVRLGGGGTTTQTDGFDQWDAISGKTPSPRKRMVYNIDLTEKIRASVRIGNYKLIVGFPGEGDWTPPPEIIRNDFRTQGSEDEAFKTRGAEGKDFKTQGPEDTDFIHAFHRAEGNNFKTQSSEDSKPDVERFGFHERLLYEESNEISFNNHNGYEGKTSSAAENPFDVTYGKYTEGGNGHDVGRDSKYDVLTINRLTKKAKKRGISKDVVDFLLSRWESAEVFGNKTEIRLYNVHDDPEERNDLAEKKLHKVKVLLEFLLGEIVNRYVPADIKPQVPSANPKHWNNVWSPGWCQAS